MFESEGTEFNVREELESSEISDRDEFGDMSDAMNESDFENYVDGVNAFEIEDSVDSVEESDMGAFLDIEGSLDEEEGDIRNSLDEEEELDIGDSLNAEKISLNAEEVSDTAVNDGEFSDIDDILEKPEDSDLENLDKKNIWDNLNELTKKELVEQIEETNDIDILKSMRNRLIPGQETDYFGESIINENEDVILDKMDTGEEIGEEKESDYRYRWSGYEQHDFPETESPDYSGTL